jgi:hypothetical protein
MSLETVGLGVAPIVVNKYLWDTLKAIDPNISRGYGQTMPIFPLGDAAAGKKSWENKPYLIYDRMFKTIKVRHFYPVKHEEITYFLKAKEQDTMLWGSAIQLILDRADDAGKDINDWIRQNGGSEVYPVYFHSLKVYQTMSSRATEKEFSRDFSVRPFYISEFIIDMKYHNTKSLEDYL